ncbi:hypothetical protein Pmani_018360 [Petrolisthes manimaculis]|uniref:Uncharacterized protein n=1 Tax=Petrolisthes manimaculis TaxID=1843537 RepID=A0AAE1U8G0_9EUCA|nr:hypothetical protein Pmani_018360 [Petrolisthes manimaculis]
MRMWSEQCVPARPLLTWGRGFKEEREDTVAGKETVRWLNLALPGSPLSVERTVVGLVEGAVANTSKGDVLRRGCLEDTKILHKPSCTTTLPAAMPHDYTNPTPLYLQVCVHPTFITNNN